MDKELRDRLYWLTEELTEEERALLFDDAAQEEEPAHRSPPSHRKPTRAEKMERRVLRQTDPVEERSVPVAKKKGIKDLVFLAALEILGILAIIGWWLQWLI